MTEFVRSIQKRIEDVPILDVEALCDFADKLRLNAPLGIVRVVHHQADRFRAVARPLLLNLIPELERNGGKNLAPVIRLIGKKPIEHVLLAVEQAA